MRDRRTRGKAEVGVGGSVGGSERVQTGAGGCGLVNMNLENSDHVAGAAVAKTMGVGDLPSHGKSPLLLPVCPSVLICNSAESYK
jgi:hypothetical protein